MKLSFLTDPNHGWLKVPLSLIKKLGIENEISFCSYFRKDFAYLEEDVDAPLFIKTYKEKFNKKLSFKVFHTNKISKIRSYLNYGSSN